MFSDTSQFASGFAAGALAGAIITLGLFILPDLVRAQLHYIATKRLLRRVEKIDPTDEQRAAKHADLLTRARNLTSEAMRDRTELARDAFEQTIKWFPRIGGTIGFGYAIYEIAKRLRFAQFLIPSAYAGEVARTDLAPVLPYVFMAVVFTMGVAFLAALIAQFTLEDTKANVSRIRAADNIVKTFGGFFTGLATTLLR